LSQPLIIVRIADLERGKKHYDWELPVPWLRHAFEGTEATIEAPGSFTFDASITSRQVIIRGKAQTKVTVPCARTLDPVPLDLAAEVFLVLRPAATAHDSGRANAGSATKKTSRPTEPAKAASVPKARQSRRPDAELSEDEAAEDVYQGDHVELDESVREFLLLELPMMPLRSDLRSEERPAIPPTPETALGSESSPTVDPRLKPLAEIASRLSKTTKE
jgi:uncharacterized metal-binding protein YceD (DUF177 family)